jgi:hypothetical protein
VRLALALAACAATPLLVAATFDGVRDEQIVVANSCGTHESLARIVAGELGSAPQPRLALDTPLADILLDADVEPGTSAYVVDPNGIEIGRFGAAARTAKRSQARRRFHTGLAGRGRTSSGARPRRRVTHPGRDVHRTGDRHLRRGRRRGPLVAARLTRPLKHLASSVEAFDQASVPLPAQSSGVSEIARLADAFANMQARLANQTRARARACRSQPP